MRSLVLFVLWRFGATRHLEIHACLAFIHYGYLPTCKIGVDFLEEELSYTGMLEYLESLRGNEIFVASILRCYAKHMRKLLFLCFAQISHQQQRFALSSSFLPRCLAMEFDPQTRRTTQFYRLVRGLLLRAGKTNRCCTADLAGQVAGSHWTKCLEASKSHVIGNPALPPRVGEYERGIGISRSTHTAFSDIAAADSIFAGSITSIGTFCSSQTYDIHYRMPIRLSTQ